MYHYIEDRAFLGAMRAVCADVINRLVQKINNDDVMEVKASLIGSGRTKLVVQNGKADVDLDYNLRILRLYRKYWSEEQIKEYVADRFNDILNAKGLGTCGNSTSCLTTKKWSVTKDNPTKVKIDLGIVRKTERGWQRLICEKTGNTALDRWFWNDARNSRDLEEKVQKLKEDPKLWQNVRDSYLEKKNMYLRRNDRDHPSYIVYIETVNEIYNRHFEQRTVSR